MVIPRESRRITYSSEIRQLKTLSFTENQRAIVVGSVLGDGCLHPNWSKTNYTLKITRSEKQYEYVKWQYANLQPFVRTPPRFYEPTLSYTIRTVSHSELSKLYTEFYLNGKKVLPLRLEDYLKNPLTVAVWFMDDGNIVRVRKGGSVKGYHLNTQSFSRIENALIEKLFKDLHGINSNIEINHGYSRVAIWQKKSREKFKQLIAEHIIPSMQYKLG